MSRIYLDLSTDRVEFLDDLVRATDLCRSDVVDWILKLFEDSEEFKEKIFL